MTQLEQLHTLHMYPHSGTDFHGSAPTVWCFPEFLFVRWDSHSDEAGLNAVMRDYMKLTCMSGIRASELAAEVPRGDNSSCDWSLGAVCVFLNKFLMLVKFVKSPREERKRSSRFLWSLTELCWSTSSSLMSTHQKQLKTHLFWHVSILWCFDLRLYLCYIYLCF